MHSTASCTAKTLEVFVLILERTKLSKEFLRSAAVSRQARPIDDVGKLLTVCGQQHSRHSIIPCNGGVQILL